MSRDTFIWLIISFLLALSSNTTLPFACLILCVLFVIHRRDTGQFISKTPFDALILVVCGLIPISILISIQPAVSILQAVRLIYGIGLFYALNNWANENWRIQKLFDVIIYFGVLLSIGAPLFVNGSAIENPKVPFLPSGTFGLFNPIFSDAVNSNVMSGALVVIMPLAFSIAIFAPTMSHRHRVFNIFATSIILFVLILLQSRGGLFALFVSLIILISLRLKVLFNTFVIIGALIIVFLLIVFINNTMVIKNDFFGRLFVDSISDRLNIWNRALLMIAEFPFTGVGMGMFEPVGLKLYAEYVSKLDVPHAHNMFLQIALDLGIIGLMMLILMFIKSFALLRNLFKSEPKLRSYILGVAVSLVAVSTHGLTDAVLWGMVRSAPLMWVIFGLVVCLNNAQCALTPELQIDETKSFDSKLEVKNN
jgi:putative inorganic carbon (HCO3(-)) transporter